MSSTRYLEFDSSFRNRNLYPNPASFAIDIAQSGAKNSRNAVDPVSIEAPIMSLNNLFTTSSSTAIGNITTESISYNNTSISFTLKINDIIKINGYYEGSVMESNGEYRKILEYRYISGIIGFFRMETSFILIPINITIKNPTDINNGCFFIANGPMFTDNSYNNWYIHNLTKSISNNKFEFVQILYYNASTKIATFNPPSIEWNPSSDEIVLREQLPTIISNHIYYNRNEITLRSQNIIGNLTPEKGDYIGSFFNISYNPPLFTTIFYGSISSGVLTITTMISGVVNIGMRITKDTDNIMIGYITGYSGSNIGFSGSYYLNTNTSISPTNFRGVFNKECTTSFIGSSSTSTLNVTSNTDPIYPNLLLPLDPSTIISKGTYISFPNNIKPFTIVSSAVTNGGIGNYTMDISQLINSNTQLVGTYKPSFTVIFTGSAVGPSTIISIVLPISYGNCIYIGMTLLGTSLGTLSGSVKIIKQLNGSTVGGSGDYITSSILPTIVSSQIAGCIITPSITNFTTRINSYIPLNYIVTAVFTGSASVATSSLSTTLTVSSVSNGVIEIGMNITSSNNVVIINQLSGIIGGIGDYTIVYTSLTSFTNQLLTGSLDPSSYKLTVSPTIPTTLELSINNNPYYIYQIYNFTRDNCVPFSYTGSIISQQEPVCYQVDLLNLILPNVLLSKNPGSRITFYPYIYVELVNLGSGSLRNSIYSNNPNSTKMLFRCPINDVPNPVFSSFVKIDGDGMSQTIKFKPNDNFLFGVYLSNGNIFETLLKDTIGPLPPTGYLQISASFAFKRL